MGYTDRGTEIRLSIKEFVYDYMKQASDCASNAEGMRQADIFRDCGLDWGDYPNTTSSQQQFWIVALLRELEKEGRVLRDSESKRWRVK